MDGKKWELLEGKVGERELDALKLLGSYYDGKAIIDWLGGLWDKETGGFYYANSSRDCEGFLPDIESTVQTLRWAENNGAFAAYGGKYANALDGETKERLIGFAKSLQCKEDGYFYHPQWGKDISGAKLGRDLGWSRALINTLGGTPDYPTALDRLAMASAGGSKDNIPEWFKSKENYLAWLSEKSVDMRKNSGSAHLINANSSQIIAAGYLELTLDYLDEMQQTIYKEQLEEGERPTGLWQKPTDYRAVWGLLKYAALYRGRPIKHQLEIARTCVDVILLPAEGNNYHMNDVFNQWSGLCSLIGNAKEHQPEVVEEIYEIVRERLPEMVENSIKKILPFKQADGTFSYCMGHSSATTNHAPVSLGLPEGDVNATALCSSMYRSVFTAAGLPIVQMCDEVDGERFLATLRRGNVITKKSKEAFGIIE